MIARGSAALAVLALLATGDAGASGGWKHVEVDRQQGAIEATLSYETRPSTFGIVEVPEYRKMRLVVRRPGTVVVDDPLRGTFQGELYGLRLRNVWGDGEPEALVEMRTPGNRCCVWLDVALLDPHSSGRVLFHDFGNIGWQGHRHDRTYWFVSYDSRFKCAFTNCADSSMPIQIFAIDRSGRSFVDVTRRRPDLIAASAAEHWWHYQRKRGIFYGSQPDVHGTLAPWCAEQYLLRREKGCDQALAEALALGYLRGPGRPANRSFINLLHKKLAAWGYDGKHD